MVTSQEGKGACRWSQKGRNCEHRYQFPRRPCLIGIDACSHKCLIDHDLWSCRQLHDCKSLNNIWSARLSADIYQCSKCSPIGALNETLKRIRTSCELVNRNYQIAGKWQHSSHAASRPRPQRKFCARKQRSTTKLCVRHGNLLLWWQLVPSVIEQPTLVMSSHLKSPHLLCLRPHRVYALCSDDSCASPSVRPSVCPEPEPNCRMEERWRLKFCNREAQECDTGDSWPNLEVRRSKVKVTKPFSSKFWHSCLLSSEYK